MSITLDYNFFWKKIYWNGNFPRFDIINTTGDVGPMILAYRVEFDDGRFAGNVFETFGTTQKGLFTHESSQFIGFNQTISRITIIDGQQFDTNGNLRFGDAFYPPTTPPFSDDFVPHSSPWHFPWTGRLGSFTSDWNTKFAPHSEFIQPNSLDNAAIGLDVTTSAANIQELFAFPFSGNTHSFRIAIEGIGLDGTAANTQVIIEYLKGGFEPDGLDSFTRLNLAGNETTLAEDWPTIDQNNKPNNYALYSSWPQKASNDGQFKNGLSPIFYAGFSAFNNNYISNQIGVLYKLHYNDNLIAQHNRNFSLAIQQGPGGPPETNGFFSKFNGIATLNSQNTIDANTQVFIDGIANISSDFRLDSLLTSDNLSSANLNSGFDVFADYTDITLELSTEFTQNAFGARRINVIEDLQTSIDFTKFGLGFVLEQDASTIDSNFDVDEQFYVNRRIFTDVQILPAVMSIVIGPPEILEAGIVRMATNALLTGVAEHIDNTNLEFNSDQINLVMRRP